MYIDKLSSVEEIIIPFKNYTDFSSNYIFTIVLKNSNYQKRDNIRNRLAEAGVQTSVHYPAVHRFSIYKDFYRELPVTDYLVDNLITLPMHSKLSDKDIMLITDSLKDAL